MKMSASRLARASRSKFFIGIGLIILTMSFLALFNSSQHQMDELRQLSSRCEIQQQAVSAQMQIVVDQKLRLENSLASERMINEQNRQELHQKSKDEKELHNKSLMEANLRYASLQQHFKLLKSQHDDLNDECSKTKKKLMEDINGLQAKLNSLHGQVNQAAKQANKEVERLKAENVQLQAEKSNWKKLLDNKEEELRNMKRKNNHLEKENEKIMENCHIPLDQLVKIRKMENDVDEEAPNVDNQHHQPDASRPSRAPADLKSFNEQITVSEDTYQIPIRKHLKSSTITNIIVKGIKDNNAVVAEKKSDNTKKSYGNGIINSVENFQIIPKPIAPINSDESKKNEAMVLQQPIMPKTSTSINDLANKKTSESVNNLHVPILAAPTAERPANEVKNASSSTTSTSTTKKSIIKPKSKLPVGVVPIPDMISDDADKKEENNFSQVPDSLKGSKKAQSLNEKDKNELNFLDGNGNGEQENGANEVQDLDFNMAHNKDNDLTNDNANAAEEENLYDTNGNNNKLFENADNHDILNHHGGAAGSKNKLKYEVVGDHGKEGDNYANEEDLHLEAEGEDGDVGEYDDPTALKNAGHAERN